MLSSSMNEYLCRVGPGTPMGETMRRYWWPAVLSEEIVRDGDPRHVRLLGEDFVAFRDSNGKVGFLDELCPHRRASLTLGRVEDCGIRCIYHGWKFGVDGALQEAPNVVGDEFVKRGAVHQPSYPTVEAGGFVWVYIGPPEKQPPFRRFHWFDFPPENIYVNRVQVPANYLQVVEGGLDISHVNILHRDFLRDAKPIRGVEYKRNGDSDAPTVEVELTDFGAFQAGQWDVTNEVNGTQTGEKLTWLAPIIVPNMVMVPPGKTSILYVPVDDVHTEWMITLYDEHTPIDRAAVEALVKIKKFPDLFVPRRDLAYGVDAVLKISRENGYGQNRPAMDRGDQWAGMENGHLEDAGVQVSMGRIVDRTHEHMIPSDRAIAANRQLLLASARSVEAGGDPIGVQCADLTQVNATRLTIGGEQDWRAFIPNNYPLSDAPASGDQRTEELHLEEQGG